MDEADRFVGCIWAMVDGIGGVNVRARGDNSGVVGVLDMMLIQQIQLRLINFTDSTKFNTFTHMQRTQFSLFICFCYFVILFAVQKLNTLESLLVFIDMHMKFRRIKPLEFVATQFYETVFPFFLLVLDQSAHKMYAILWW